MSLRLPLVFWLVWTLGGIVAFLVTGIALDVAQVLWCLVLFRYLYSIDSGSWMASCMASPATVLVLFGSLGLRLLLISGGGGVVGPSLFFVLGGLTLGLSVGVLLVLGRRAVAFRAPGINVPNIKGRLQVSFGLYITCLLYNFLPAI